jgi:hypothetical protein
LEALVPDLDWNLGLAVWNKFRDLPANRIHQQLHPSLSSNQLLHDETEACPPVSHNGSCALDGLNRSSLNTESVSSNASDLNGACESMTSLDLGKTETELTSKTEESGAEYENGCKNDATRSNDIKYRASCLRTGVGHPFPSPHAAAAFGGRMQDYFGWTVDLVNFDLEVVLHVEERHVYVKLALTKCSLHRRNILVFGQATLKPTIAYCMLRLVILTTFLRYFLFLFQNS